MEIKANTKFNIGQKVYTCHKSIYFKDGNFQNTFIPDKEPKVIDSITVLRKMSVLDIFYSFKGNLSCPETMVFNTLEEAEKWCDAYE